MLYGSAAYGTVEYGGVNIFGEEGAVTSHPFPAFALISNQRPRGIISDVKLTAIIKGHKPTI